MEVRTLMETGENGTMNGLFNYELFIEQNNIGWSWWNYKKIGTINAPVSSPTAVFIAEGPG